MGGVEIVKEKLDLICPYTREKIKYPVRGRYCKHFGCACLQTIIAFHNMKRQWICPQCDGKVNEPYIDLFVYQIIKDKSSSTSVYISKNGNYEWVQEDRDAVDLDDSEQQPANRQKEFEQRLSQVLAIRNQ